MKKVFALPFLLLLICAFQTKTATETAPKIKKMINLKTGNITEYLYYENGNIDREINSSGTKITYGYLPNMVVKKLQTPVITGSSNMDTFILNDKGLAKYIINYQNSIRFRTDNEYDDQGHVIKVFAPADLLNKMHDLNSYTFTNGNRTKIIFWDDNKKPLQTQTETYFTDKKNTIGNENMGLNFLGKSSANLLKQDDRVNYQADSFSVFYSYRFDEKDRVRLKVSRNKKGVLIDSISYSYY